LDELIRAHIEEGRYPGCQIALARHGKLALFRSYGMASTEPRIEVSRRTLWLLYSGTKVITTMALWSLVDDGHLTFNDRIADLLPNFAAHGKEAITVVQLLTHQAGFPNAAVSQEGWFDRDKRLAEVCGFKLEWPPGERSEYHVRSAHWVVACMLESLTGQDYRQVIRERVIGPLGLQDEILLGVPPAEQGRLATTFEPANAKPAVAASDNAAVWREAGIPSSGGYATARGLVTLFQATLGHRPGGARLFSPRLVEYALRNRTGERVDPLFGLAMHRGLGPHLRGTSEAVRSLGSLGSPSTFGQGGVGTSTWWADPESGVSFAYLTSFRQPEPWHSRRMEIVSNLVHSAVEPIESRMPA
jgi:CubicO group peptidase (beta-lactamase class C family)